MSQRAGDAVPAGTFLAAAPAPPVLLDEPARQHRPISSDVLTGHHQPEFIEAAESGQIRTSEGNVRHVEVFQMGGVGTSIFERPRPLSRQRRADHPYTVKCEEPRNDARCQL